MQKYLDDIKEVLNLIKTSSLEYNIELMSTIIRGELKEVMDLIRGFFSGLAQFPWRELDYRSNRIGMLVTERDSNLGCFRKLGYIILGILLSVILLFTFVEIIVFNLNHYRESFIKYNIIQEIGMNEMNLQYTLEDLLEYLRDNRGELDTKVIIEGREDEAFENREKLHMIDVKKLFFRGRMLRNIAVVLFIIMGPVFIIKDRYWKKSISGTLLYTSTINILFLFVLLLLMKIDFDRCFTYFHIIFFNNDLWMLDPNTHVLVQMLPEGFFYDTSVRIVLCFLASSMALGLLGLYFIKRK